MGFTLTLAGIYVPKFVRRKKLLQLFAATADAFGECMPPLGGLDNESCLKQYALYTRQKAEEAVRNGTRADNKRKLYFNAFSLGAGLREQFGVKNMRETMRLARMVYDIVGIDFCGAPNGEIVIRRCLFSSYYSPEVCDVVSSLDAGLLSGISGGARLTFSERLTGGCSSCRARLSFGVRAL